MNAAANPAYSHTLAVIGTAEAETAYHDRKTRTSIIIPAYNEESGLPLVLTALGTVIDASYEIIVVDDGSSDSTVEVAKQFPCRVLRHTHNQGKGAAMRTGLAKARGTNVIFIDADNTYPVENIPVIVELLKKHQLVRGVRSLGRDHIPVVNRIGNLFFDTVFRMLHSINEGDVLSGLYGVHRDCLLSLNIQSSGFDIETEIVTKAAAHGYSCATFPISYSERVGEKKLKVLRDGTRILQCVFDFALAYNPAMTLILPGMLIALVALAGLLFTNLPAWLTGSSPFSYNTSFLTSFFILAGIQLVIFGLAVYEVGSALGLTGHKNELIERIITYIHQRPRRILVYSALASSVGLLGIAVLTFHWLELGLGEFHETFALVSSALLMFLGIQLGSAVIFLATLRRLNTCSA